MAWMPWMVLAFITSQKILRIDAAFSGFEYRNNYPKRLITEDDNTVSDDMYRPIDASEDVELQRLGKHLTEVLLHPGQGIPLVYVEEYPSNQLVGQFADIQQDTNAPGLNEIPYKRSRYYRKYPWKRQNSREAYDAENRYLCQPTREDVFRLLVALHEARQGNRGRTVNFCNRKRPAATVFTNIRFLGKRK